MRATYGASLLFAVGSHAAANFPAPGTTITFWRDAGCPSDASSEAKLDVLLPSTSDICISGTYSEHWPVVSNDTTSQVAYFTGDGLPESCNLAILDQATIAPGECGTPADIINGGTTGTCKPGKLPVRGGVAICCGGSGKGCAEVPGLNPQKRARRSDSLKRGPSRDVTDVKRKAPFQRLAKRDCTFKPSGSPYIARGAPQLSSGVELSCPSGETAGCPITHATTITVGSSNTFGVSDSITAGDDFFVDIQDTVSFSYMYTYSESESQAASYTLTVPPGEKGYAEWTPTVSCIDGSFSGQCSWSTGSGVACVPLYSGGGSSGNSSGVFSFLQEQ